MKVSISHEREGWYFASTDESHRNGPFASYPQAVRRASTDGHEIDNGGWLHRLLMWNFNSHSIDGFPEWEIENKSAPAFAKLMHTRGKGKVESHEIATAWDDVATVDFYQRDWTDDGLPCVSEGTVYWSGWWFATIADRDRFLRWIKAESFEVVVQ